jgi:hypothetical protein
MGGTTGGRVCFSVCALVRANEVEPRADRSCRTGSFHGFAALDWVYSQPTTSTARLSLVTVRTAGHQSTTAMAASRSFD